LTTAAKTKLHRLFEEHGQSPWIDNLKRSYLLTGQLQQLVDEGIRGVTANPTIFQKAVEGSSDYDEEVAALAPNHSMEEVYWALIVDDVRRALEVLRPLHDRGGDGFVSIEVSPTIAHDTEATVAAARSLHRQIDRPNLFVKIPATEEGVPAIRQMISEGRSINVTLIFSLSRYDEVIEAYISGLEAFVASGGDPSNVYSVASFFVSRVDTEVDRRLEKIGGAATELAGRAAVAQAKLAYQLFLERHRGPRWEALRARGAKSQRPLWASTSTKNPAYPDLLYVDNLIGPDTVNTMPDATVEAFLDHGVLQRTIDQGVDEARAVLDRLAGAGIDLDDVTQVLEDEGVASFTKSFVELMEALAAKVRTL
jgi:transaldolase